MSNIIIWRVRGMHCASCERVIEQTFIDVPGVMTVDASLRKGSVWVELAPGAPEPDFRPAYQRLNELGYFFQRDQAVEAVESTEACEIPNDVPAPLSRRFLRAILAIALISLVAYLLAEPLQRAIPNLTLASSFGAIFFFGVLASLSTCLASTGGFILAYVSRAPAHSGVKLHAGRLAGFVAGGALLGGIGGSLPTVTGGVYGIIALLLGIGFLAVALHLLDLTPSLASFGIKLPKRISALADRATASKHPLAPFLVGASTFFLPCGFTQTTQALALASGSPWNGALLMGAFALGTLPVLSGISTFGNMATLKHRFVRLAAGAILAVFAFTQIDGGLIVLGSPITPGTMLSSIRNTPAQAATLPEETATEQVMRMTVSYTYLPNHLTARVGVPVRWEIDGADINGCSRELVAPAFGIRTTLRNGPNVLRFTPKQTGTFPFSCGMGMLRGSITITN